MDLKLKPLVAALLSASLLTACGGEDEKIVEKEVEVEKIVEKYQTPSVAQLIKDVPSADTTSEGYEADLAKMRNVLKDNAKIAHAMYTDAAAAAAELKTAIDAFAATDGQTQANLDAAKTAWLVAREAYGQSEVYRFRNSPIDNVHGSAEEEDGPEGSLNAWPLGEALIDYVQTNTTDFGDDQVGVTANSAGIKDNGAVTTTDNITQTNAGDTIIGSSITIDAALLANSATAEDEHDVISGYHAIEFLLWGQDLNNGGAVTDGTDRADAVKTNGATIATGGLRPLADFTTNTGAERRLTYLQVATDLMVEELESVRDAWDTTGADTNYVNDYFLKDIDSMSEADVKARLTEILTGMGTLSEGELAGERMQIALATNSQEDEHSCFSDNTHRDIVLNAEGVYTMFTGDYAGYDKDLNGTIGANEAGTPVEGYGIYDYLVDQGKEDYANRVKAIFEVTKGEYNKIDASARAGKPFDVLIQDAASEDAESVRNTILMLNKQSSEIQNMASIMKLDAIVVDGDGSNCDTTNPTAACD